MSLKEMSRCQAENIANQNASWHSPNPWLMAFSSSLGTRDQPKGPKVPSETPKTKDTGSFQATGFPS